MKNEKSIFTASILNFIVWGSGYYYLNKKDVRSYIAFVLYILISMSILFFIITASPLLLPILFWVIFWSLWISIFIFYDTYKSSKVKSSPLKIIKVKKVVRRSKVRARKK